MPRLTSPVLEPGCIASRRDVRLVVDELELRPFALEDAEAVREVYDDPAIQQWHAQTLTAAEAEALTGRWSRGWAHDRSAEFAVTAGGVLVGRTGLREVRLADGWAEVAYWVHPAHRGRRVAPRALAAVTRWAFDELGVHRIELQHAAANTASCRVATLGGYAVEGTRRSHTLHPDGWHDMHLHARIRE